MSRSPFDAVVTGVLAEPQNAAQVQEIIDAAVRHARDVFTFGTYTEKTKIATALIGLAAKNAAASRQSEAEQEMRREYAILRTAVQGSVTVHEPAAIDTPSAEVSEPAYEVRPRGRRRFAG